MPCHPASAIRAGTGLDKRAGRLGAWPGTALAGRGGERGGTIMNAAELIRRWERVHAGLLTTIGKFADGELDYVPVAGGFSVAQLILHIAHEEQGEIHHGITHELAEWPAAFPRAEYRSVAALATVVGAVHARTETYLRTLT